MSLGLSTGAAVPVVSWAGTCRFNTPGEYAFYCEAHPNMTGTVSVAAGIPTIGNVQFVPTAERDRRRQELAAAGACGITDSWLAVAFHVACWCMSTGPRSGGASGVTGSGSTGSGAA